MGTFEFESIACTVSVDGTEYTCMGAIVAGSLQEACLRSHVLPTALHRNEEEKGVGDRGA